MYSNMHTIDVTTAFGHGVDILKNVRDEIATDYSTGISGTNVAEVLSIEMHSATTFTVRVNAETILEARPKDSEYVVKYTGFIDYIVFDGSSNVTLTYFLVGWTKASKEWFEVTMATKPAGKTVVLTDGCGNAVYAAASGKYYLHGGTYIARTSSVANYDDAEHKFKVIRDMTETVELNPTEFFITFNIDKSAAVIDYVKDSNGNEIAPYMSGVYKLANSTVGGTYTYSVSCTGYTSKTGTLTVTQDATENVTFEAVLSSVEIATPPTKTTYTAGERFDPAGMVVKAVYDDGSKVTVTNYTVYPEEELSLGISHVVISYTEGSITVTVDQLITVTE